MQIENATTSGVRLRSFTCGVPVLKATHRLREPGDSGSQGEVMLFGIQCDFGLTSLGLVLPTAQLPHLTSDNPNLMIWEPTRGPFDPQDR